ncbi:MAG TPA: Dabb family protein [Fibrobacteria bacterium]|nr:Dabb family protein [Fibrobacteria bacterium]HOX52915.1 Dabb family protein [Fibrobacteria bacterium]
MIRHILLLEPNPTTTSDQIEEIRRELGALVGQIPGLLDFNWGVNFAAQERRGGFDYGFTMDLIDRAALAGYAPHPLHQAVAAKVRAAFGKIVVLDFEF